MSTFPAEAHESTQTPPLESDSALLKLVAKSDRAAFLRLHARHSRAVFIYCLSIVRDGHLVEEACQETWLALWNSRSRLTIATDSALPWLFVTGRHKSIDCLRLAKKHRSESDDEFIALRSPDDTEAAVEFSELLRFIDETVGLMPPVDRALYELCIVQSLSYADAAIELGLTTGSVRNRIHRLRVGLRTQVRQFGEDNENS